MKMFDVAIPIISGYRVLRVKAENEQEAKDKAAMDKYLREDYHDVEYESDDRFFEVEEV